MKINLPDSVSRKVAMTVLKTKKHSPTILFTAGLVGMGATVVTACRSTLKLEGVLDRAQDDMETSKRLYAETVQGTRSDYSEHDHKQDMLHIYIRTGFRVAKLYAPSVVLGGLSVAALTGSHKILTTRNAGLTAAYAALDKGFKEYRARVVDEYGEDKDREFRFGTDERTVTVEGKNGPKKTVQKKASQGSGKSIYARFFDENNKNWDQGNPEYRLAFIKLQQNWLNDRLRARGHVFLNEAYEALGFEHTPAGSQVGWLWGGNGDDYIDFGMWADKNMEGTLSFMNGWESGVWLDFNVDGEIWKDI